jgi:hypothetical protein
MKAMTRKELAYRASVDRKTFSTYLEQHEDELRPLGLRPRARVPPVVVKWLVHNYGINIDEK